MVKICDRCKLQMKKAFYRYPHVWEKVQKTYSTKDAIFSVMLQFCEKCVRIFDQNDINMRAKYLFVNNPKLIEFYMQYRRKKND
jgi:hypothetical protein